MSSKLAPLSIMNIAFTKKKLQQTNLLTVFTSYITQIYSLVHIGKSKNRTLVLWIYAMCSEVRNTYDEKLLADFPH